MGATTVHLIFIIIFFALLCPVSHGSVQFNFGKDPYKYCFDYAKTISEVK